MGVLNVAQSRPFEIRDFSSHEDLRFAYLNLKAHPRGEMMLNRLVETGFVPSLIIEEDSPLAEKGRVSQLGKLRQAVGFSPPKPTELLCAEHGIELVTVDDHNNAATREALLDANLDLGVLGDTRILRTPVMDAVPGGIVNVHPGRLPDVRGNNPYIWAVIHDLPQGVSAHLIDSGVDLGPVILVRDIDPPAVTTLPQLLLQINETCGDVVVAALDLLVRGEARLTDQPPAGGPTFREARPEIWSLAAKMLSEKAEEHTAVAHAYQRM
ncbi:formyltransferase family protein [Amycolatopsis sp. NPDC049868]|uniref:formyltransferase family protein n=1 Tax=Amycolatopsis sp. NPDC049868 TaxID=3363934 RepID=UPI0037AE44D8